MPNFVRILIEFLRKSTRNMWNSHLLNAGMACSALAAVLWSCQTPPTSNKGQHDAAAIAQLKSHVEDLASPEMEGRETGSAGEALAAKWLSDQFEAIGCATRGDSGAYQAFQYTPHPPMQVHGEGDSTTLGMAVVKPIIGHNILYTLAGTEGRGYGVLAAHYDHLGYGGENSLFRGEPTVHFGADDNASGVATMLEVAEALAASPLADHVLYAGFSGEEKGLWGSNHFCESPTVALDSIRYMINLDMVGRLRGDTLAVYGTGTSPRWMEVLEDCNEEGFILVPSESGVGPSDHTSFYLEDIPVLHFFTGQHPDYHRPTDTPEKLNYDGMLKIARYVERVMRRLDDETTWEFTKTKDQDEDSTPRFKVTLGVVPDYLYSGSGMRIDGVTEGRPAANAGLKRGDVVVRMDTVEVTDMMSYMQGLSVFDAGMTTEVEVERSGERIAVEVTWD